MNCISTASTKGCETLEHSYEDRVISQMKFLPLKPGLANRLSTNPQISKAVKLIAEDDIYTIKVAMSLVPETEWWRFHDLTAQRLYLKGEPKKALEHLQKIELTYEKVDLLFIEAMSFIKTKQFPEACDTFVKIYRLSSSGNKYSRYSVNFFRHTIEERKRGFEEKAAKGDPDAQFYYGLFLANGISVEENEDEAVDYYKKAVYQGHAEALYRMGWLYDSGKGVKKNSNKAACYYKSAADKGHTEALFRIGWCYDSGKGVVKDNEKAAYYYKKAVDQGHAGAQANLGWYYSHGQGVKKNSSKAAYYYKKAADKGNHQKVLLQLGKCYLYGRGVQRDYYEAIRYFELALNLKNFTYNEKNIQVVLKRLEYLDLAHEARTSSY